MPMLDVCQQEDEEEPSRGTEETEEEPSRGIEDGDAKSHNCCSFFSCFESVAEAREVYIGNDWQDTITGFQTNAVRTNKYTCLTFLPLNLFEQMQKFSNFYYVVLSAVMWVGENTNYFISPLSPLTTLMMIISMMAVTAIISILDDCRRCQADRHLNNQVLKVVEPDGSEVEKMWCEVLVGDVVCVRCDETFAADLIALACSGDEGTCFVSTASLDGETNLKLKTAAPSTQSLLCGGASRKDDKAREQLQTFGGKIEAEPPRGDLYEFFGTLQVNGGKEESLGPDQLLLRSTVLRNTDWCLGVVVYTGKETRMGQNSAQAPLKMSNIERIINRTMVVIVGTQGILSLVSATMTCVTKEKFNKLWYVYPGGIVAEIDWPCLIGYFLTFFILYCNMLPPSLYASLELVNWCQSYFIKNDLNMYDAEQGIPALTRTSNLCQELGQVSYVFSDKTGTLTQNVMDLKMFSIGGAKYGQQTEEKGFHGVEELMKAKENQEQGQRINNFLEVLAVCHTVQTREDADGVVKFEAESPDEGALVEGVADLGWRFTGRKSKQVFVQVDKEKEPRLYNVLALNAFNSTRKRNSVVVQTPSGEHFLFCKGADNIMFERSAPADHATLDAHLTEFSTTGLRTLVIGRRKLESSEATSWLDEYNRAHAAMTDREIKMAALAEQIESKMEILGASAIEDKLQVDAVDTIVSIREAGIRLWVLTGDKLETAYNIGFSTKVLDTDMCIRFLDQPADELDRTLKSYEGEQEGCEEQGTKFALMVTGNALKDIIDDEKLTARFLYVAERCSVVIACRVSPKQKSQVVKLVRNNVPNSCGGHRAPVTLAIGDGANDVEMINSAHVGVGIYGREGRQAVNASDFAIAQFRFLKRLLLVHGRWNYRRACKLILYSFWKNTVFVLCMFIYTFDSAFSGTPIFSDMIWNTFNIFLFLPIICVGIFDYDLKPEQALKYPKLYASGRKGLELNTRKVALSVFSAMIHSLIIVFVFILAIPALEIHDTGGYYSFGTIVYSGLLASASYRVGFMTTTWNIWSALSVFSTFFMYILFLLIYGLMSTPPGFYMVPYHFGGQPIFWCCMVTLPLMAYVVDMAFEWAVNECAADKQTLVLEEALKDNSDLTDHAESLATHSAKTQRYESPPRGGTFEDSESSPHMMNPDEMPNLLQVTPSQRTLFDYSHPDHGAQHVESIRQGGKDSEDSVSYRAGEGEMSMEDVDESLMPSASSFAQQELYSLQCALDPRRIICIMSCSGLLFMAVGMFMYFGARANPVFEIQYAGDAMAKQWSTFDTEFKRVNCTSNSQLPYGTVCDFYVNIPEGIKAPVEVAYILSPFYQNHLRYIQSASYPQLSGDLSAEVTDAQCPAGTREDAAGRTIFPCGLIATSFFNDTLEISGVEVVPTDIAWKSDVGRFENPSTVYPGGTELDFSWLFNRYPNVISAAAGVTNQRFVSWMRPAGLKHALKPFGLIQEPLPAGEIKMRINSSFPIEQLGATKSFFFTHYRGVFFTSLDTIIYRGNLIFGAVLLGAGITCLAIALMGILVQCFCHREAGQPRGFSHEEEDEDEEDLDDGLSLEYSHG